MIFRSAMTAALLSALAVPVLAEGHRTPAPEGAMVYFIGLEDGQTVSAPVMVNFGLSGMGVAPAGTEKENTGHHHILVNRAPFGEMDGDEEAMSDGLPADDMHRHFGGGQTEVMLDLGPGQHTLQLVLGDAFHVPHDPPIVSEQITITVE
ncbi:DUF4399 domain-containing protein [Cognatishimia sp. F0-27]|uniref:DUF4399 domain-containing protein n=1 Tax=Cognatishimia sp. F0-27 TaxID=2816855 RepID=UPI001D0C3676|nr:DUF4399 domain-containing protein [Cognatishimia sp. F0-27]MCC1491051.1 DUF4399 domain-containing protein [Cognatishimia sp. F0-27]